MTVTKKKKRRRKGRLRGKHLSTKMGVQMTYRSSWELAYFKFLDDDVNVVRFYSESLRIPYVSNKRSGRTRHYIPDLLVEFVDSRKKLIEIKPSKRVENKTNAKKFEAARQYCMINGIEFQIITEKELKALGLI